MIEPDELPALVEVHGGLCPAFRRHRVSLAALRRTIPRVKFQAHVRDGGFSNQIGPQRLQSSERAISCHRPTERIETIPATLLCVDGATKQSNQLLQGLHVSIDSGDSQ